MSLLDEYIQEMGSDVEVDEFRLKESQMKLPAIKHKWVGRLVRHKRDIISVQSERRALVKTLVEKIQSTSEYKVTIPAAEKLAYKHDDTVALSDKIKDLELVIEFLEKCDRIFNSMTYDIKNLVEIIKMETL